MADYSKLRKRMVEKQIAWRGVTSEVVLAAMRNVPRERFVPKGLRAFAYDDSPLLIGAGQTISQPFIVAYMVEALVLQGGEKVLEIGTGSGYAAAVLAEIAAEVYTIERIKELAERASAVLEELGYDNVHVRHGDGTVGWPAQAPFDAIVASAGGPEVPETLKHELKIGGRLVIPIGQSRSYQELVRVTRVAEEDFESEDLTPVRFVPLVGEEGWSSEFPSWQ
jgi:protein-L-isoaspartate(D-aspartate) O-methyltransferase